MKKILIGLLFLLVACGDAGSGPDPCCEGWRHGTLLEESSEGVGTGPNRNDDYAYMRIETSEGIEVIETPHMALSVRGQEWAGVHEFLALGEPGDVIYWWDDGGDNAVYPDEIQVESRG